MSKIVKPDLTYQWASAAGDGTAKGLKITLIGTRT